MGIRLDITLGSTLPHFSIKRNKIIAGGINFQTSNATFLSLDASDSSSFSIEEFQRPTFNQFLQGKLVDNNRYAFLGDIQDSQNGGQFWMTIIDTNQNVVLEKMYGTSDYEVGRAIIPSQDGSLFLLGSSRGYGSEPGFYNQALLIKTDSLGNELWRTTWGGYFDECTNNLAATPDGGVIACGCISEESSSGNWQVAQGYVRKMDAEGNMVWDKTYDWQSALVGGSVHSFNVVRVLENENIIVVGSGAKLNVDTTGSRTTPWAVIFDKNGNVLMERAYTSLVGGYSSAEFQDIQPTADGGFIAGGTYYPSQGDTGNQDAFIVKLDERGCEFAECQPPLLVNELSDVSYQFSAYPNPATGIINFDSKGMAGSIFIYDLRGQLIKTIDVKKDQVHISFDMNPLASGLYLASFKDGTNQVNSIRIVKQ